MSAELNIEKYFMIPQFEVLINYPEPKEGHHYSKGDIVRPSTLEYCEPYFRFQNIFRKMEWYEKRSTAEMLHIKNIEVVNPSYYVKGDKVCISAYMWEGLDTPYPKIKGFYIGGKKLADGSHTGHLFKLDDCIPTQTATTKVY